MIKFETPEDPISIDVTDQPDVVITISGAANIDSMHIIFNSDEDEEEEIEDEI